MRSYWDWLDMKYKIKNELIGGDIYYMIYSKFLFTWRFFERWNAKESAEVRIKELKGEI